MNTLKDGRYRWVLWCVVVVGVSSVALMPQHGEPVSTGPEFVDSLWVAGDKALLKIDVSDASVLLEMPNMDDMRAMDIDDRRGLLWAVSKDRLLGITFGVEDRVLRRSDKQDFRGNRVYGKTHLDRFGQIAIEILNRG